MRKSGSEPVGMMATEVQVPLFPLEHRCKVCRLCHSHPEIFDGLTRRLLEARPRKQIISWLKRNGISLDEKCLSRHYRRHMLPYFHEALEVERRLRAEFRAIGQEGAASIASALARTLAMRALTAASEIDFEKLGTNADPELIRELSGLARTIAQIDAHAADAQLKSKLVQLRAIELDQKAGNLDRVAARWILLRLQERPQIARQVLELLDLPMPTEHKALPAPKKAGASSGPTGRDDSKARRKGTQRSRRSGARAKR